MLLIVVKKVEYARYLDCAFKIFCYSGGIVNENGAQRLVPEVNKSNFVKDKTKSIPISIRITYEKELQVTVRRTYKSHIKLTKIIAGCMNNLYMKQLSSPTTHSTTGSNNSNQSIDDTNEHRKDKKETKLLKYNIREICKDINTER